MNNKLSELSKPVAWCVGDAILFNPDTVEAYVSRTKLTAIPLYSQEYVSALREDAAKWFKAFEKAVSVGARYEERIEDLEQAMRHIHGAALDIRQNIADALIKDSGTMDISTLAGEGRTMLLDNVTKAVKAKLDPIGIVIVKLSWTDDLKYPKQVTDSINAKIEATQKTLLRENEIAQTKAEAQKAIEAARGEAESTLLRAKAESDAITLRGQALRSNPEVLQLEAINKWNGTLPQYMTSGSTPPFVQIK